MKRIWIIVAVLLLSVALRQHFGVAQPIPLRQPLSGFPARLGDWSLASDERVTGDILQVLKPDDYLLRTYRGSDGHQMGLLLAYYKVQRAGEAMHSPKNCLPGWGWQQVENDIVPLTTPDGGRVMINRYVVEKGGDRALVLYWYQAHQQVIASEYVGKVALVLNALRYRRREGALIRVITAVPRGQSTASAMPAAMDFARQTYASLPQFLP